MLCFTDYILPNTVYYYHHGGFFPLGVREEARGMDDKLTL